MDSLALFHLLNASADPVRPVVLLAIVCAKYLFLLIPLHIALVWLAGSRDMRRLAIVGAIAMAAALLASGLIGLAYPTSRPFVLGLGHTLIDHRPSAAFPSNHAIVCFTWAATLAIDGHRRLAVAATLVGLMVAWSRIYLGIHFPADMLGAGVLAAAFAAAAALWTRLDRDRTITWLDALGSRLLPLKAIRGG